MGRGPEGKAETASVGAENGPARPRYVLVLVASADGFIAREKGHAPAEWQSPEEQAFFRRTVAEADWAILGRVTHETAFRTDRRRIVFSTSAPEPRWREPTHLWLDPARLSPEQLPELVAPMHPMRRALVLGGAEVTDWFRARGLIDEALLSIEPVCFGAGLPIFSGDGPGDPVEAFQRRGFSVVSERPLNDAGTRLVTLAPGRRR